MKKFLDVNGVKVILSIIDEKIQAIDIPDLNQFLKAEDLEDYITNDELEQVREQIEDMIPSLDECAKKSEIPVLWKGTKLEYDLVQPKNPNTLYLIKEEA